MSRAVTIAADADGLGYTCGQTLPGGFRLPARMTILPLAEDGLALVSPIPLDDAIAAALRRRGAVRYLIAPNLLHHRYLDDASRRFPAAQVLAPAALARKRPELRIDASLEAPLPAELAPHLEAIPIDGAPTVGEVALYHRATRTLVVTDLLFNVTRPEGLAAHVILGLVGCRGRLAQSRMWRVFSKDRAATARSIARLLALPVETLVPAHGDIVRDDARARLAAALRA